MEVEERLYGVVSRELETLGFELVKLETALRGKKKILRIFIDQPERGITIDDCIRVTKSVGFVLDSEDCIAGPYNLEVSSPGIDRPLTQPGHFERFLGKNARIEYRIEEGGKETVIGTIMESGPDRLTLSTQREEMKIPFDRIIRANLHGERWDIPKRKQRKIKTKGKRR